MKRSRPFAIVLAVAASGLAALMLLWVTAAWLRPGPFDGPVADGTWVNRTRAWFTTDGFYPAEFDETAGQHFSWTSDAARIAIPGIDRRRPYRVRLRVRAGRGPGTPPPPAMVVSVDGIVQRRIETTNERQDVVAELPSRDRPGAVVALDFSNTFVPGPDDNRSLGVVIEAVSIDGFDRPLLPGGRATVLTVLATMLLVAAAGATGLSASWLAGLGVLVAGAVVWLVTLDAAFLGAMPDRLLRISAGTIVAGIGVGALRRLWPSSLAPEWGAAAGVTLVLAAIKIAYFWHPAVTVGDAIFQVHRAQDVAAGHYFFTSITPRPFLEFPYAIALYVVALPWWDWFPTELDRVRLLRAVAIGADAGIGLAMFFALRRAWSARSAWLFAVLWPFVPGPVATLCTANLTNLFGQGVFGVAMGWIGWVASGRTPRAAALAGIAALLAVAFLSHFSTLSVGVPLVVAVGALLMAGGQTTATRRVGWWVAGALLLATALAWVAYYSHFLDTYRETFARVAAREGAAEARSLVVPPGAKFGRWWREVLDASGLPVLAAAAVGGAWLFTRRPREGLTLALAGWGATWLAFSALGIFTAVEMRANLAAAPFVLALAVYALGEGAGRSRLAAAGVVVVSAWIVAAGFDRWVACLTR